MGLKDVSPDYTWRPDQLDQRWTFDQGLRASRSSRPNSSSIPSAASTLAPQGRPCFLGNLESMSWDRSVNHLMGLDNRATGLSSDKRCATVVRQVICDRFQRTRAAGHRAR